MSYHARIQRTIEHIEDRMSEPLTLTELAGVAGFSDFHFHRVFQTMVGDPVMEYVRKRRLAKAARDVADPRKRIVDVALDHGFQSHENVYPRFQKNVRHDAGRVSAAGDPYPRLSESRCA